MIWAAKKGSKGESLQNALKILCDFCLLLLKQLIPARGRKLSLHVFIPLSLETTHPREGTETCFCLLFHFFPSGKQLIPARGRKPAIFWAAI